MRTRFALIFSTLSLLSLTGCGGSDSSDDTSYTSAYLQFYNASSNSPSVSFLVDDTLIGKSSFADATSLATVTDGDAHELQWIYEDEDDAEHSVATDTLTPKEGYKTLIVLSGDFNDPEFIHYAIKRDDLEDNFRLFAMNVASVENEYDIYLAPAGAGIADATLLATLSYQNGTELDNPDATSDAPYWPTGDYVIYLTEVGTQNILYESATLNLAYETEYTLMVRKSAGALQGQLSIDLVINSTTVSNISDINATAQYRVYNSLDDADSLNMTLSDNQSNDSELSLATDTLSDFSAAAYGDYRLQASLGELRIENRLLSLNQGQSKALIFYQNAEQQLALLTVTESELPQVFEHDLRLVNLTNDYDDIAIYFVQADQTIESSNHYFLGIEFAETANYKLPLGYYEVVAVAEDEDGNLVLMDRTASMTMEEGENYLISLETDTTSATGYRLHVLH